MLDDDLNSLTEEELVSEIKRLRQAIRTHRDSSGHDLCWYQPELWSLLPEQSNKNIEVPNWSEFMNGCVKYRESLDKNLLTVIRTDEKFARPSFEKIYMRMAELIAQRSTCSRLSVGCVITSFDYRKVLAIGYNGNASGLPNECDQEGTPCGCLHSETNAVINCDSPRELDKIVFCTHMACYMCAKSLIQLGNVKKFYYLNEYRKTEGIELLSQVGITVEHLGF